MERMKGHFTTIRVTCEHIDHDVGRVVFRPVTDDREDNARFFAATPGGIIDLQVVASGARHGFDVGREYDVHFYARPATVAVAAESSAGLQGALNEIASVARQAEVYHKRLGASETFARIETIAQAALKTETRS